MKRTVITLAIAALSLSACGKYAGQAPTDNSGGNTYTATVVGAEEDDETPSTENEAPKGNASANNKKGGNYGKTGHEDNGKGWGRS